MTSSPASAGAGAGISSTTPQDLTTTATPTFAGEVLGVSTISAPAASAMTYTLGQIEVTHHAGAAALLVDQTFFVATRAYVLTACSFVGATAETTAVSLTVQVTKDTSTDAPGGGTDLLTNNTNAGFNVKGTANTVQAGTLTGTAASLALAAGNRLSVDYSAAATEGAGISITCSLRPN